MPGMIPAPSAQFTAPMQYVMIPAPSAIKKNIGGGSQALASPEFL